jgi:uncharacterized protein (DUF58 family)
VIFDEATLRKLNQLSLVATRVRNGVMRGERRSVKRGASLEFADYRNYTPGDDLRRLDWKIYGRLDRPFLKLYEEEEDLAVHVFLDTSQSMDWGESAYNKLAYAMKLAAALGVITLATGDRLTITALRIDEQSNSDALEPHFGPLRGQSNLMSLLNFFERVKAGGQTHLERSLRAYTRLARRPGLAFLISDLFTSGSLQDSLACLQGNGYDVVLLHVLAPEEIDPPLNGDLRLVDVETGLTQEVTVDGGLRRRYQAHLAAWREQIQTLCQQRGMRYLPLSTAQPWDQVVLQGMRQAGVVR